MLPLDQLIFEPTLTYSSPPFQSESKQANDMPNQPMHHRLGSSSSMSQSFLLTPSHITVWKVIARSKDEEISANWLQRSCNIHISTPLKRTSKHRPSTSQLAATPPCICTQPSTFFAPANTRYISSQRLLCSVLWSDVRMLLTEPNFPRAKSVFLNRIMSQATFVVGRGDIKSTTAKTKNSFRTHAGIKVQVDVNCYQWKPSQGWSCKTAPWCANA